MIQQMMTINTNASVHVQLQRLQTDCQQSHHGAQAKLGLFAVSGLFLGYAEQAGARQLCQACKWCVADEVASLGVNPTWSSVPSITKDAQACTNNNNNCKMRYLLVFQWIALHSQVLPLALCCYWCPPLPLLPGFWLP